MKIIIRYYIRTEANIQTSTHKIHIIIMVNFWYRTNRTNQVLHHEQCLKTKYILFINNNKQQLQMYPIPFNFNNNDYKQYHYTNKLIVTKILRNISISMITCDKKTYTSHQLSHQPLLILFRILISPILRNLVKLIWILLIHLRYFWH